MAGAPVIVMSICAEVLADVAYLVRSPFLLEPRMFKEDGCVGTKVGVFVKT